MCGIRGGGGGKDVPSYSLMIYFSLSIIKNMKWSGMEGNDQVPPEVVIDGMALISDRICSLRGGEFFPVRVPFQAVGAYCCSQQNVGYSSIPLHSIPCFKLCLFIDKLR